MKLEKKKNLIARVLGVGKGRIILNRERLADIKESLTKQDIKDLLADNAIIIREIKGTKKKLKRKTRKKAGKIKKKIKSQKKDYMALTRKLRFHLATLKNKGKITQENYLKLRREIRAHIFKDLGNFRERIAKEITK